LPTFAKKSHKKIIYLPYARGKARASVHSASASADWAAFADAFAGAESLAVAHSLALALAQSFAVANFFAFANWLARLFAACAGDWSPAGAPAALCKAIWVYHGEFRV